MPVEQNFRDIDESIASVRAEAAAALTQVRQLVHEVVPDVTERISYHIPMFELNGRLLVYMAAYKQHIGMYGVGGIVEEFGERIAAYVNDKGTLRFPLREPLPLPLIGDIVRFAMQNVLGKPARKR